MTQTKNLNAMKRKIASIRAVPHCTTLLGGNFTTDHFSNSVKSGEWKQDLETCLDATIPPNDSIPFTSLSDDRLERGTICLLPVAFTDGSGIKIRPTLVLATKGPDLVVAPMTSRSPRDQYEVRLLAWEKAGLHAQGTVRCSSVTTISRSLVVDYIGRVMPEDWERVLDTAARWFMKILA